MIKKWIGLFLTLAGVHCAVFADSATWSANPGSNVWMVQTNWVPITVPIGPSDVATFGASATTSILISAGFDPQVNGIRFQQGAGSYYFTLRQLTGNPRLLFTFSGFGIVNESANTQLFV